MNLSKCFDCMPHALLVCKLHAYGLSLDACKIMANYLSNRCKRTKVGTNKNTWEYLTKGIPKVVVSVDNTLQNF